MKHTDQVAQMTHDFPPLSPLWGWPHCTHNTRSPQTKPVHQPHWTNSSSRCAVCHQNHLAILSCSVSWVWVTSPRGGWQRWERQEQCVSGRMPQFNLKQNENFRHGIMTDTKLDNFIPFISWGQLTDIERHWSQLSTFHNGFIHRSPVFPSP